MSPPTFADVFTFEWCEWVLDHGLPELPSTIAAGQAVPIARWADEFAAVLVVSCSRNHDAQDGVDHLRYDLDTYCFRRVGVSWEPANGVAGSDWPLEERLDRLALPARHAAIGGTTITGEIGWQCVRPPVFRSRFGESIPPIERAGVSS